MRVMRDFRDAKAMAQTLREALTTKAMVISHSESLELVSKMLGVSDWNTLSARLQAEQRGVSVLTTSNHQESASYPALPIKDFAPFPATHFPVFVGREKTKQALDLAFERQREIVLVLQKDPTIEEPGFDNVFEIGVLARLLELNLLPDGSTVRGRPMPNGTMKVLVQAYRRVVIRRFTGEAGAFQADIGNISEGPIPVVPELIQKAVEQFENYAAAHGTNMPQTWPALDQIRDPGRIADVISAHMTLPMHDKEMLLATLDSVARLEQVSVLMTSH